MPSRTDDDLIAEDEERSQPDILRPDPVHLGRDPLCIGPPTTRPVPTITGSPMHPSGVILRMLGSLDGKLRAYSAQDGNEVWSTQAPGPIITSVWADGPRVFVARARQSSSATGRKASTP